MLLETERLRLRPLHADDLDAVAAWYADPEVMRYIGPGGPMSREDSERSLDRMRANFDADGFGQLAVVRAEDGALLGRCGLLVWTADTFEATNERDAPGATELEVGWLIAREHWGRGYATEAALAVRDYALGELGRTRLISLIRPGNVASERVAEKIGERYERDVELMGTVARLYALGNDPAR